MEFRFVPFGIFSCDVDYPWEAFIRKIPDSACCREIGDLVGFIASATSQ